MKQANVTSKKEKGAWLNPHRPLWYSPKVKKIILFACVFVNAVFAIYALGFFTDFWKLSLDDEGDVLYLYQDLQSYNKTILFWAIMIFVVIALLFLLRTALRKKLYWTNITGLLVLSSQLIISSIFVLTSSLSYKTRYMNLDVSIIKIYYKTYKQDPVLFNVGIGIAILLFLAALPVLYMAIGHLIIRKEPYPYIQPAKEGESNA